MTSYWQVKSSLKRTLMLAMASLLLVLTSSAIFASPANASPQDTEKSIVRLQIDWTATVNFLASDNKRYDAAVTASFNCTGFFVSTEGHIATAGHCVDDADAGVDIANQFLADFKVAEADRQAALNNAKITSDIVRTVWAYQPPGVNGTALDSQGLKVQVVDFDPMKDGDNALLKINNFDTETPALTIADGTPEIGTEITAIGFPGSVGAVSDDSRRRASFKQGKVSSRQTSNSGVPFTEIDASMSKGMSGGPTIDANTNAVYGVNSFGINGETGDFNSISDTDDLRAFLQGNGVELSSNGDGPGSSESSPAQAPVVPAEPADSSNGLVGILIAVIIVLVVGGGTVGTVLLVKSGSRSATAPQPQPHQQQWPNQPPQQQPPPNWRPPQGPGPNQP